jgi:hypothetical protein
MDRIAKWVARFTWQKPELREAQILGQWEKSVERGLFPYLSSDEHGVSAGARFTAFRSTEEWLVVFELPAYVGEADAFVDRIYAYGNEVKQHIHWVEILCPTPYDIIDEEGWQPDLFDFEVLLHGRMRRFKPTQEDYVQAGIDFNEPISSSLTVDRQAQVLRVLVYLFPEEVFLSECRLLEVAGRPRTLSVFLQMYEWHHPDLRANEKPSDSPCLRSLARALAHNRPGLYKCPKHLVNTHWSQWPNYLKPE